MSVTQVMGPQVGGGYKLAVCLERNADHEKTKRVAVQLADALKLEPWYLQVDGWLSIWAATFDGGRDFHTRLPAATAQNTNSYLSDYGLILPAVRGLLPGTNCVGLGVTDLLAGSGSGGGGEFTFSVSGATGEVFHWMHEMGHGAAGLGDEYVRYSYTYNGAEPLAPNLTIETRPQFCKWRDLFPATGGKVRFATRPGQVVQTVPNMGDDEIGIVEGGNGYHAYGIFKPTKFAHCRMGDNKLSPFCAVCKRAVVAAIRGSAVVEPVPAPPATVEVKLRWNNGDWRYVSVSADAATPDIIQWRDTEFIESSLPGYWYEAKKVVIS